MPNPAPSAEPPVAPALALDPNATAELVDPELGEDSSPPPVVETKAERRARLRAELAARGRVRTPRQDAAPTALPVAAAGSEPLAAARDRSRSSVLEKNPYLMQR